MARRRALMMMQNAVLDTSPEIIAYDKKTPNNSGGLISNEGTCVTRLYEYPAQATTQTLVTSYVSNAVRTFTDGKYKDYWSWNSREGYYRNVINVGSNALQCTIITDNLDDCYAYLSETGQILFAGKNSIYYGHRNISELN